VAADSLSWIVPRLSPRWALFLDVDGTLLDIAARPELVEVPPGLTPLLAQLAQRLEGALAIVSGRALADIDGLFQPHRFPAAGIHGAERRDALGELHLAGHASTALEPARAALREFVALHPGLLLEDKGRSLALHFRQAPHLEGAARELAERLLAVLPPGTQLQPGHSVIEIKGAAATKRTAIEQFLQEPPFAGRVPVFLGDDLTDEDGLSCVEAMGGHAVFVGTKPQPGRGWLPHPAAVRAWLGSL